MSEHETEQTSGPEPQPPPQPRRLLRSTDDRVLGGVAGGLGAYFDVDPVFFRIGFVALTFLGGLGLFLYLAALLFVPSEAAGGAQPPTRSRALTIAAAALLVVLGGAILFDGHWWFGGFFGPLGLLLLLGAGVWWLIWGRSRNGGGRPPGGRSTASQIGLVLLVLVASGMLFVASAWGSAAGGGVAVAILVIAIGALLAVAAFRGGARWLVVPALAITAGLGVVAAADIDLDGGYGDRTYTPTSLADLRSDYDLGAGKLEIDLRGVDFTAGERKLDLEVGLGEALLVVPRDLCVIADADVGAGYLRMLEWDDGGVNVAWDDSGSRRADATLLVDAHVGVGSLEVVHDPHDRHWQGAGWDRGDRWDDFHNADNPALGRSAACVT
jgi:phage shock protein PspC (stress-responsive transcriptional regulator)